MTTTVVRKESKPREKKATPKKEVARRVAAKTVDGDQFAPDQQPLPTMEDVDERIESLDEECQQYFSARDSILSGREATEEALDHIGDLLRQHGLDCYILNGKKFYIEPAKATVKVKKVKQQ